MCLTYSSKVLLLVLIFVIGSMSSGTLAGLPEEKDVSSDLQQLHSAVKRFFWSRSRKACLVGGICFSHSQCCHGYICGGALPGLGYNSYTLQGLYDSRHYRLRSMRVILPTCYALPRLIGASFIQILGAFEDVYSHTPGNCTFVPGIDAGSEDLHTLPDGSTFISSGLSKLYPNAKMSPPVGNIYFYNMSEPHTPPRPLKLEGIEHRDFIPHGLSALFNWATGDVYVFVVSHHKDGDRIEKFRFHRTSMTLRHMTSFHDNRLTQANDVVAVSENAMYFTNYLYSTTPTFKMMELYMPMTWGAIYYWQLGHRPQLVARRLKQPNGILTSADGKLVYVAHEGHQELLVYTRQEDNYLNLTSTYKLNTSVDKMSLSSDGRMLWVGSHAVFWKVHQQLLDPDYQAPSQVLCLRLKNGVNVTKVTEVFADDGSTLKGSSSASYYKGRLLIGTVVHKLMLCDLTHHHS